VKSLPQDSSNAFFSGKKGQFCGKRALFEWKFMKKKLQCPDKDEISMASRQRRRAQLQIAFFVYMCRRANHKP
jgi:hypothetical protein